MNRMSIKSFLDNELCDYAKYSTIRAIPSCIDGLKNSGRKGEREIIKTMKNAINIFMDIPERALI